MQIAARGRHAKLISACALIVAGAVVVGCAAPAPKAQVKATKSKEYFPESVYGVKASPRVSTKASNLPRGGGRDQLGKPYKVRGQWFYPKEDPNYVKIGAASWYGDAFHGRLTANGEVYDMTHLTAAHPTMPLPSYARVTNTDNGHSVVVRVNDRGPFARGRVIDLSRRAAEMLDYKHAGVAKVKVEYMGRAPLHGQDDQFLMASYRPGNGGAPSEEIATGVMIAMAGPSPSAPLPAGFPGAPRAGVTTVATGSDEFVLPSVGPALPERPALDEPSLLVATLSYADERVGRAGDPFSALEGGLDPSAIVASWRKQAGPALQQGSDAYVAVGTFADRAEAERFVRDLGSTGRVELVVEPDAGRDWFTVNVHPDGRNGLDGLLQAAWAAGAADAMPVRN
jgi:rare lipoprotein A